MACGCYLFSQYIGNFYSYWHLWQRAGKGIHSYLDGTGTLALWHPWQLPLTYVSFPPSSMKAENIINSATSTSTSMSTRTIFLRLPCKVLEWSKTFKFDVLLSLSIHPTPYSCARDSCRACMMHVNLSVKRKLHDGPSFHKFHSSPLRQSLVRVACLSKNRCTWMDGSAYLPR